MGSRIMHLIIGHKIAESLSIEDKASFLLGSIAPDAVFSHEEKTSRISLKEMCRIIQDILIMKDFYINIVPV